jgi:signal transduction histidine kinase
MAGDAKVRACFTNSPEPCGGMPVAPDDGTNESGCTSASRLAVPPKELGRAHEIEAIAAQARGMGHDLNNLLAIITTYTRLVLEDLKPDDPSRPDLEEVCQAAERAHEVARRLSELGHEWRSFAPPI